MAEAWEPPPGALSRAAAGSISLPPARSDCARALVWAEAATLEPVEALEAVADTVHGGAGAGADPLAAPPEPDVAVPDLPAYQLFRTERSSAPI